MTRKEGVMEWELVEAAGRMGCWISYFPPSTSARESLNHWTKKEVTFIVYVCTHIPKPSLDTTFILSKGYMLPGMNSEMCSQSPRGRLCRSLNNKGFRVLFIRARNNDEFAYSDSLHLQNLWFGTHDFGYFYGEFKGWWYVPKCYLKYACRLLCFLCKILPQYSRPEMVFLGWLSWSAFLSGS